MKILFIVLLAILCGCSNQKPYTEGYTTYYPAKSTTPTVYQTPYDIIEEGNKITTRKTTYEAAQ
ncbi:MAG: hypothetical protein PHQ96_00615 [Candidatus Omnitrophica bacterium]|nr:hypothetical protein [Candidatus Omnitrophota bacterium]